MLKKYLFLAFVLFVFFFNDPGLSAQLPTPINYGQSIVGNLPLVSSTASYTTPSVQPGDVLLVRTTPSGLMQLKLELYNPSGGLLNTYFPVPNTDYINFFYTIPPAPAGGPGNYKMIVSGTDGFFTGNFCIFLQRANESPNALLLNCNSGLSTGLDCISSFMSVQYMVQQGAVSRITIDPNGLSTPEAWLCAADGTILRYGQSASGSILTFDTISAPYTGCYYVFITDFGAFFTSGGFNASHTLISGACAAPSVQVTPPSGFVCEGSPFSLTATSPLPNTTYAWSGPNGFTSSEAQISFPEATDSLAGGYTVTVTIPTVCSIIVTKTITINPLPSAEASVTPMSGMLCAGQNFTLNVTTNASSPVLYQWSKAGGGYNSTQKSPTVSNADISKSGTYVISVTDGKGCAKADSIEVTVNPLPSATISSPANGAVCLGATLFLNVTTDAQNASFLWSGPQGFSSTIQNPSLPNAAFSNGGTYSVTVTNIATGCSNVVNKFITVNSLPTANISGTLSICAGMSTVLTASGGGTYLWSTGATTSVISVSPPATNLYIVTVTNANTGCTDSETASVTVKPLPVFSISSTPATAEICEGDGNILLCVIPVSNAETPSYQWTGPSFFSNQQCVSFNAPSQTGMYQVSLTSGVTGCSSITSFPVKIHALPTVDILPIPAGLSYCDGEDFTLCANSNASAPAYQWSGPDGFAGTTLCVSINNAGPSQAGNYNVTVTDNYGCTGANGSIVVVDNPISITASVNGDQINATATGGTPPFQYVIFPGGQSGTTGIFQDLDPGTYTITATDKLGCTASTSGIMIVVGIVEPSTAWGLSVMPNPGSGFFEVRLKNAPADILLFDVFDGNGRLLRAFGMQTATETLDLTDLPSGLYVLRVSDGEKTGVVRLAIMR